MKMPALFIGHGSPMNVLQQNSFTMHLSDLGKTLPHPKAILVISAHWLTHDTSLNAIAHPKIIYDFYGFPKELYNVQYECPGFPELAEDIASTCSAFNIHLDKAYGLDHASWSILKHMFPEANIPVIEMSINVHKPFWQHISLGKELEYLRKKGVLIIGSGNMVHNLSITDSNEVASPYDWAVEADEILKRCLTGKNTHALLNPHTLGNAVKMGIPSSDHYIPMLYILGMQNKTDNLRFTHESIQHGSISMRSFMISSE